MNYQRDNDPKFDLKIKINKGRYNILFIVIMSVINIFMITSGNANMLPYSSAISNYSVALGVSASEKSGDAAMRILGLAIACAVLMLLMVCYILSKSKPVYFVISLAILAADTIALLIISIVSGTIGSVYVVLDILIHILAVVYLVNAFKAFNRFIRLSTEEINQVSPEKQADTSHSEETFEAEEDINVTDDCPSEDLTKPIGKFNDDGTEPLVKGEYNGLEVFVVIRNGTAELIINCYVCDELDVACLNEYQLRAIVNGIDFSFEYKRSYNGEAMFLYADDTLLDSLGIIE